MLNEKQLEPKYTLKQLEIWMKEHSEEVGQQDYTYEGLKAAAQSGRLKAHKDVVGDKVAYVTTISDLREFLATVSSTGQRRPGRPRKKEQSDKNEQTNPSLVEGLMTSTNVAVEVRSPLGLWNTNRNRAFVISVLGDKGGIGKTATTASLAHVFSQMGLKVLAPDNEPQANLGPKLGVVLKENLRETTIADVYLDDSVTSQAIRPTNFENLWLLPSSARLAEIRDRLPNLDGADDRLRAALAEIAEQFDLMIIDNPPGTTKLSTNSLMASDGFLIPVSNMDALKAVQTIVGMAKSALKFRGKQIQFLGLFLTRVKENSNTNELREVAERLYPDLLLKTEIRESEFVEASGRALMPVTAYRPKSGVAQDYVALANELATRIGFVRA